jgi:hypothetical protein
MKSKDLEHETHFGEKLGHGIGYISSHIFVNRPFYMLAIQERKSKAYLTALVAANTIDYILHACRRSKDSDRNIGSYY